MKFKLKFGKKARVTGWCKAKAAVIVLTDLPPSRSYHGDHLSFWLETNSPINQSEADHFNSIIEEIVTKVNEGN